MFGSRSSPNIFDSLSTSVCWIASNKLGVSNILHLLDDFLTIDPPDCDADRTMAILTMLFKQLKIPLAPHKTVGPTQCLEYLGVILDAKKNGGAASRTKSWQDMRYYSNVFGQEKSY